MIRRALLAFSLLASLLAPAFAQAPPPVPALPDTERRTTYTITGTTCACAVGFQIYGDNNDVDNWIQVWVNGVRKLSTDATFGWALSSATGPTPHNPARRSPTRFSTFNSVQTATVQIVGAERPRRLATFAENTGVTARSLNQLSNTLFAELREGWDKTNDLTGRVLLGQPGNTFGPIPLPASCANMVLGFDATGLNPVCTTAGGGGGGRAGRLTLNTQVQYNAGGVFGGISGVTSNGANVTIASGDLTLSGSSSGSTTLNSAASGGGTLTLPAGTTALAGVGAAQTWTAVQTFNANDLLLGGVTGSTQCLHANSSGVVTGTGSDCGSGGRARQLGANTQMAI